MKNLVNSIYRKCYIIQHILDSLVYTDWRFITSNNIFLCKNFRFVFVNDLIKNNRYVQYMHVKSFNILYCILLILNI